MYKRYTTRTLGGLDDLLVRLNVARETIVSVNFTEHSGWVLIVKGSDD